MQRSVDVGAGSSVAAVRVFASHCFLAAASDGALSTWEHRTLYGGEADSADYGLYELHAASAEGAPTALSARAYTVSSACSSALQDGIPIAVLVERAASGSEQARLTQYFSGGGSAAAAGGFAFPLAPFAVSAASGAGATTTSALCGDGEGRLAIGDERGCCSIRSLARPDRCSFSGTLQGGTGPAVHDIKFYRLVRDSILVARRVHRCAIRSCGPSLPALG